MQLLNNIAFGIGVLYQKGINLVNFNPLLYTKENIIVITKKGIKFNKKTGVVQVLGDEVLVDDKLIGHITKKTAKMLEKSTRFGKKTIIPTSTFIPTPVPGIYSLTIMKKH